MDWLTQDSAKAVGLRIARNAKWYLEIEL